MLKSIFTVVIFTLSSAAYAASPAFLIEPGTYTKGETRVEVTPVGKLYRIFAKNDHADFTFFFNPENGAAHIERTGDMGIAAGTWDSRNEMMFYWNQKNAANYHSLTINLHTRRLSWISIANFKIVAQDLVLTPADPYGCQDDLK